MVAELQVAVDEDDLPTQLAMERDGRVDGDGRGAHAALGAVVRVDAAQRRASDQRVLGREPREEALHPRQQLGRVERLDEIVVGAGAQATDLLLHLTLGGEHDDGHVPRRAFLGPDLGRHLVAVELGQHHVEEDQRRVLLAPEPEPFGPVRRDHDVVALLLEGVLEQSLDVRVVVDDEDLGCHRYL